MSKPIESKCNHDWKVKGFGWRSADNEDSARISNLNEANPYPLLHSRPKPGSLLIGHNRYFCYGCNTGAIGSMDYGLFNEETGDKIV